MITAEDYSLLSELLIKNSGLALGPGKEYLLQSRLPPVAATFGHANLPALFTALRRGAPANVVKSVCDAMTTGETLFFRDGAPFQVLKETLLPEAVERAGKSGRAVRIWCAACSTGQEAYSVAMTVSQMEHQLGGTRVEILATDYSSATVARARNGVFSHFDVQRGLPVQLLVKHFKQVPDGYQISEALRKRITFQEHNLLTSFGNFGEFDIVFCRNVLIYFDTNNKRDVMERIARQVHHGGCVLLGGAESTLGITEALTRHVGLPAPVYRRTTDLTGARRAVA
jgi:chemotaxis protein methyltransferase CheR